MTSQRLLALGYLNRAHENDADHSAWPLTVQNLAIHEAGEISDPTPLHFGVLVPPQFLPPLFPHYHQFYPQPQPYLYPPNMMNEEELGLHGGGEILGQSGAPYPNNQQQVHGYYQQQAPPHVDYGGYWSQQQGSYGGYENNSTMVYGNNPFSVPIVYGDNQCGVPPIMNLDGYCQQAPPLTDYGNYWHYGSQQQDSCGGYESNQFGVPPMVYEHNPFSVPPIISGGYYGGGQYVVPNHIDNQFGSPINMDGGSYGRQTPPHEGYYNTQGGAPVNINQGPDNAHVEISGIQKDIGAPAAAEWTSGWINYGGESSPYHNRYDERLARRHSMSAYQEQMLPEQLCYDEVPSSDYLPTSGTRSLRNIDFAPQMNCKSTFNDGPRNSPNHSPGILYGPGRLQSNNSVVSCSMNKNSALISGRARFMDTNTALMTGDLPSRNNTSAPIRGLDRSQTGNHIVDTNSALVRLSRRHPGPHPPRWCCEDAIATVATEPRLPGSPDVCEDKREEKSSSNIFSSFFLKSVLHASTVFEDLARVDGISEAPASTPHCPYILMGRCQAALGGDECCSDKLHFKRVVHAQTDVRLGDCSFLDSCDLADKCPYIHYEPDLPGVTVGDLDRPAVGINEVLREEVGMGRLADHVGLLQVIYECSNLIDQ